MADFDTTEFDKFFNMLVNTCIIEYGYNKIGIQLDKYDAAVRKTDPKGLTEEERDEFIGILCIKYADDFRTIQSNAFKNVAKIIDQFTDEDRERFFSLSYDDYAKLPELCKMIFESVSDSIRKDIERLSVNW